MATIWDYIVASIIKQAELLIIKYLPEIKKAMKEAVREELEDFFNTNPIPDSPSQPIPEPKRVIMFDLPVTAVELNSLGFPGYEGEILYCLGQVVKGWPIPDDPGHPGLQAFARDPELRRRLEVWYDQKVTKVENNLLSNENLTVKILENDAKDRFGFRIGPPTMDRLSAFGSRVEIGYYVPENEY